MALITVNDAVLPDPNTVDPNDIYWHYQTLDALSLPLANPIDHGYYGAGLDPNDDFDTTIGWVLLTTDYRDLPTGLLQRVQAPTTALAANIIPSNYYEVAPVITSSTHTDIVKVESTFETTNVGFNIINPKDYVIVETTIDTSDTKDFVIAGPLEYDIVNVGIDYVDAGSTTAPFSFTKLLIPSDTITLDIGERLFIEDTVDIDIGSPQREIVTSTPDPLDVLVSLRSKLFTTPIDFEADITLSRLFFIADVAINVGEPTLAYVEDDVNVDIVKVEKFYSAVSTSTHVDIQHIEKITEEASAVSVYISGQALYDAEDTVFVDVVVPEITGIASNSTNVIIATEEKEYGATTYGIMDVNILRPMTTLSDSVYIEGSTAPLYVGSSSTWIDVYAIGTASLVHECEWPVLRHLGTEDWRFLSVLEESQSTVPVIGTNIRFHEMLAAGQAKDVIYNIDNQVERLIIYTDETKAIKMAEIYVEYTSGFPHQSTLMMYDANGLKYYDAVQTYMQGINNEILPDQFTVNNYFLPAPSPVVPSVANVNVGDLVYFDNFGIAQKGLATDAETSRVRGFVIHKPSATSALLQDSGLLPIGVLSGLTIGQNYFLSETVPGGIQASPVITPSNVLKFVGEGTGTGQLWVDVSRTQAIRA